MENKFFKMFGLEGLLENAQGYMDAKLQIVKLDIQEKFTNVVTLLLLMISVLFLFLMMLAFLSMALGYFLNSLLNSSYLGFLIMGVLFFMLIVLLIKSKPLIHNQIKKITSHFMESHPKP